MKERLLKFLSREQLTSKQFAGLIGVQPSSVSHILSGRNKPSFDFMEKIALNYPSLSLEWLISGNGNMFRETKQVSGNNERDLFSPQEELVADNKDENIPEVTNVNKGSASADYKSNFKKGEATDDSGGIQALSRKGKKVEMIIVMYSDKTFSEYFPSG